MHALLIAMNSSKCGCLLLSRSTTPPPLDGFRDFSASLNSCHISEKAAGRGIFAHFWPMVARSRVPSRALAAQVIVAIVVRSPR